MEFICQYISINRAKSRSLIVIGIPREFRPGENSDHGPGGCEKSVSFCQLPGKNKFSGFWSAVDSNRGPKTGPQAQFALGMTTRWVFPEPAGNRKSTCVVGASAARLGPVGSSAEVHQGGLYARATIALRRCDPLTAVLNFVLGGALPHPRVTLAPCRRVGAPIPARRAPSLPRVEFPAGCCCSFLLVRQVGKPSSLRRDACRRRVK